MGELGELWRSNLGELFNYYLVYQTKMSSEIIAEIIADKYIKDSTTKIKNRVVYSNSLQAM